MCRRTATGESGAAAPGSRGTGEAKRNILNKKILYYALKKL